MYTTYLCLSIQCLSISALRFGAYATPYLAYGLASSWAGHIGRGWDNATAQGWFRGTVHSSNVPARDDLNSTPSANYVAKFKSGETKPT